MLRAALKSLLRPAGRSQQELARRLGLHPSVLSHKLRGAEGYVLTHAEVKAIVKTLAEWQAITTRAEAARLLEMAGMPAGAFSPEEWARPPLAALDPTGRGAALEAFAGAGATAPREAAPGRGGAASHGRLPAPATALVDRERERAEIRELLRGRARLVTLTGPGGVGKTRLALAVAGELPPEEVAFVDLTAVDDPALVPLLVANALGIEATGGHELEEVLREVPRSRRLLLVLDNFEHVLPAAALVADLLAATPGLKVLATSRSGLALYGEHEYRVPPLGDEQGVELFCQRAGAVRPAAERGPVVAEICRRLDGLPLAIELAAARCRLFAPGAILARLADPLGFLTGGPSDLPVRQRALRGTLDWSYDLLDPGQRQLFARLGVFAGGFDAAAAGPLDELAALADAGLLEHAPPDADGEPRFRMLQTVREYALERLDGAGRAEAARAAHAAHFLALAETAERHLRGAEHRRWADRLALEQDNLRAALGWLVSRGEGEPALRLAAALGSFWAYRGYPAEGRPWLAGVLALPAPSPARARALLAAGIVCREDGHDAEAADWLAEARAVYAQLGDAEGVARAEAELALTPRRGSSTP